MRAKRYFHGIAAPSMTSKQSLYENAFDELCGWLIDLLQHGALISLIKIQEKYQELLRLRNETITETMLRTTSIRERLKTRFKQKILFSKLSNTQGVYCSWSNIMDITQSVLTNSATSDEVD